MKGVKFNNSKNNAVASTDVGIIAYVLCPTLNKKIILDVGRVTLANVYCRSNVFCFVEEKAPNIVKLWNGQEEKKENNNNNNNNNNKFRKRVKGVHISNIEFTNPVLNVLLLRDRVIVVFQKEVTITNYAGSQILNNKLTFSNPLGLCSMIHTGGKPRETLVTIATLGSNKGEIAIWKLWNKKRETNDYVRIEAHENEIVALKLSPDASLVATASSAGTIIKIFDTKTKENLFCVRRGSNLLGHVGIYDICIKNDNKQLACHSTNGTIHIFDLEKDEKKNKNTKSLLNNIAQYLPSPQYFSDQWSKCAIKNINQQKSFMAYGPNGNLHVFSLGNYYYKIETNQNNQEKLSIIELNYNDDNK